MYERVKKNYYLIKNIENSRLAAIFSVPMFYHKFYLFSSKSAIYKYSDIAWVSHINPYNEVYKYQVGTKDIPGGRQAL